MQQIPSLNSITIHKQVICKQTLMWRMYSSLQTFRTEYSLQILKTECIPSHAKHVYRANFNAAQLNAHFHSDCNLMSANYLPGYWLLEIRWNSSIVPVFAQESSHRAPSARWGLHHYSTLFPILASILFPACVRLNIWSLLKRASLWRAR